VRVIHELADGMNNADRHVYNFPMVRKQFWPWAGSLAANMDNNILCYLGLYWINQSYDSLHWWITTKIATPTPPTSSDYTDWSLISSQNLYVGPLIYDENKLNWKAKATVRNASETNVWVRSASSLLLTKPEIGGSWRYLMLAAKNSNADTWSQCISLSVQPFRDSQYSDLL
jgi:hypothetical protein